MPIKIFFTNEQFDYARDILRNCVKNNIQVESLIMTAIQYDMEDEFVLNCIETANKIFDHEFESYLRKDTKHSPWIVSKFIERLYPHVEMSNENLVKLSYAKTPEIAQLMMDNGFMHTTTGKNVLYYVRDVEMFKFFIETL